MNPSSTAAAMFLAAVFTHNLLLHHFLGMCPALSCSRRPATAVGMGLAVTFVITCTAAINHLAYHHVLAPLKLEYLALIVFVAVIAAFVQIVEIVLERFSPALHERLGIFLPLTTVNCAILGVSLLAMINDLSLLQSVCFGLGAGVGWLVAIVLLAHLRRKMRRSDVPEPFRGVAIAMVIAAVMAMAFMGVSGLIPV